MRCLQRIYTDLANTADEQQIQRDKVEALQRVGEDMRCLQRIYTDLANTADEQQMSFDTIESHMATAVGDIEGGREQLALGKYRWDRQLRQRLWAAGGTAAFVTLGIIYMWS